MAIKEVEKKYHEQLDMILDNPNEKNLALTIPVDDLRIFGCRSISEFKEFVLERIIQKASITRDIDFEPSLNLVYSRLKLKERY